jgi:DNA modification methylase
LKKSSQRRSAAMGPACRPVRQVPIGSLKPNPRNPRKHGRAKIEALAKCIDAFDFNAPILVDRHNTIVAGHARWLAAKRRGMTHVPVIRLEHLSEAKAQAYMLADNKLTDRSEWDETLVAVHLKELSELTLDFNIEATGFEVPEIDRLIQSLDCESGSGEPDRADELLEVEGPSVSRPGDLFRLGEHRVYCGDSREPASYAILLKGELASTVFGDGPYNVRIYGHVSGLGKTRHREFAMGSGEMSPAEYTQFMTDVLTQCAKHSRAGSIHFQCIDWRHVTEMLTAGRAAYSELLNLCIWVKTNGGMGAFYRSAHELVWVFKNGRTAHRNNVQLGRYGRNRTNVWTYPGVNGFARKGQERNLQTLHPTVKPVALVADAILDTTARKEIVLDPFLGSGTTIIAAERTGRRGCGIEIDPLYVDTAIRRWQRLTGKTAYHQSGRSFAEIQLERSPSDDEAA